MKETIIYGAKSNNITLITWYNGWATMRVGEKKKEYFLLTETLAKFLKEEKSVIIL
jgi:hypothetical protein